ncbi:MAG: hypothetical protein KAK00_03105 [Nanoarchaeota archaeon]|nr:hypothetical protein [Nanoarchaeota archaeon]
MKHSVIQILMLFYLPYVICLLLLVKHISLKCIGEISEKSDLGINKKRIKQAKASGKFIFISFLLIGGSKLLLDLMDIFKEMYSLPNITFYTLFLFILLFFFEHRHYSVYV